MCDLYIFANETFKTINTLCKQPAAPTQTSLLPKFRNEGEDIGTIHSR